MTTRRVYDVALEPLLGRAFQPTSFPDLGAATFTAFHADTEVPSLLVESVQSMGNHLENTGWDYRAQQPHPTLTGLPYVRVEHASTGDFLTASRLEAHRLASPFVRDATAGGKKMFDLIRDELGLAVDTPLNYPRMAAAIMTLDPFCLVHGVFFNQKGWFGQPRFTRAVSAVIEAHDVRRRDSGGRKSDAVRHHLNKEVEGGGTAEGYGSVPFHRVEFTARQILASFVVDLDLLRSYGLPQPATDLLEALALWEIRSLLDGGLRLRTACDLEIVDDIRTRRGDPLPTLDELTPRVRELVAAAAGSLGDGAPITVTWKA